MRLKLQRQNEKNKKTKKKTLTIARRVVFSRNSSSFRPDGNITLRVRYYIDIPTHARASVCIFVRYILSIIRPRTDTVIERRVFWTTGSSRYTYDHVCTRPRGRVRKKWKQKCSIKNNNLAATAGFRKTRSATCVSHRCGRRDIFEYRTNTLKGHRNVTGRRGNHRARKAATYPCGWSVQ